MSEYFGGSVQGQLLQLAVDIRDMELNTMPGARDEPSRCFIWNPYPDTYGVNVGINPLMLHSVSGETPPVAYVKYCLSTEDGDEEELQITGNLRVDGLDSDPTARYFLETIKPAFIEHPHELCVEAFRSRTGRKKPCIDVPAAHKTATLLVGRKSASSGEIIEI